jgi:hypothetical protein
MGIPTIGSYRERRAITRFPMIGSVPSRPATANAGQRAPYAQPGASNPGVANPPAAPIGNPSLAVPRRVAPGPPFLSAAQIGAVTWRPPNLPLFSPSFSTDNLPMSERPFAPPIPHGSWLPTSSADISPVPAWLSSQSLLGRIADLQDPISAAAQNGLLGKLFPHPPEKAFGYRDRVQHQSLLQDLANLDRSAPPAPFADGSGYPTFGSSAAIPSNSAPYHTATYVPTSLAVPSSPLDSPNSASADNAPLSRFLNALNPIGTAQAAEDEGGPLPPGVAEALARALRDAEAAKKLIETQDVLKQYHDATRELFAAAQGKSSRRALGRALEASGVARQPGYEAHHIVAGGFEDADPARQVLQKFGIGINEASNGVFLPADKEQP